MDTSKHKLGLIGATFFIIGSLAGSGVIALPQQLAAIGSITLLSFLLVTAGALCLTLVYVRAGALFDNPSPTALAAYVNPLLGAKSGLFYVYSNLISNVSILIAGLGYLTYFVPSLNQPIILGCVVIALIWVFTLLALRGAKFVTMVVSCSVTALLLSVVLTAIFGWFSFDISLFKQNWDVANLPQGKAILSGFAVLLFSYVGVEAVANNYELVNNPKRNVPIATIAGFIVVAVLYIVSTTVLEGMFTAKVIQNQPATFSLSIEHIFGSKILGQISSLVMAIACLSSFLAWNISVVSAAKTSADHGFLPKIYSYTNKYKVGSRGLLLNAFIMTCIELGLMFLGSDIAVAFNLTVTISILLVLFPYFWSGIALIKKGFETGKHSYFDITIASLSSVFLISAFMSADFAELWLVIVCVMVALAGYALLFASQKK
ncbi:amino acid permease [Halodesulfovibrio spirochaetisodalis]|uniref:Amino acid permease n=1 Tax=Halodesulfovibrio spirochaetisodalis TaxID=1560234 RepID=A0A1B7XBG6_9BACT|nr:amino acid permease [Halodesulfovibrio spirochaetisodalis]OBQ50097.1 hypothetical protein SP90_10645 [Halodesulfovibrio spirochaetisodalis]